MRTCFILACFALAVGTAACTSGDEMTPLTSLDAVAYRDDVQPLVEQSCGTLDCHGRPMQPLRIYSALGLRLGTSSRTEGLSDAEIAANMASFAAIDPAAVGAGNPLVDQNLVLLKALAIRAGGVHHVGGDIWLTQDTNGYQCVHGWLAGATADDPVFVKACQDALAESVGTSVAPPMPDGGIPVDDAGNPVDAGGPPPPVDMGSTAPPATWTEVYALFRTRCTGCHGTRGSGGYSIPNQATGYTNTVGTVGAGGVITPVTARYCPTYPRINPFDPMTSGVYLTLIGGTCGRQMPPGTSFTSSQIARVASWINDGAQNN